MCRRISDWRLAEWRPEAGRKPRLQVVMRYMLHGTWYIA